MKKIIVGVLGLLVLLAIFLGPDLLGLYRLERFVATSDEAYQADGGPWPHLTDVCTGCHGFKGRSADQRYPSLAGQPASYVAKQLRDFANGLRANPTMGPLAMTMDDAQVKLISEYFGRQSAGDNASFEPDAALRDRGKQLVAAGACRACHGDALTGRDPFPRLANQGYDYLVAQLDAFASGARTEPTGTMKKLAAAASRDERKAMAAFLASIDESHEKTP